MRHARLAVAAALAPLLLAPPRVEACSVCGCGDPLAAAGSGPGVAGSLRLSLDGEWLRVRAASEEPVGGTDVLTQSTLRLGATWTPVERLNLVLQAPLLRKQMVGRVGGATEPISDVTNVGDVEVGARWFPLGATDLGRRRSWAVGLQAGVSLPTGPNGLTDAGERLDEHAQPGTGGFGPVAGAIARFAQGPLTLVASGAVRVRTENGHAYRYGTAILWSVLGEWDLAPRITVGLGLDGREASPDRDAGAVVEDTGGLVLAAAPAAAFALTDAVFLTVRAQLPVATRLRGEQSVDPTVTAGVQWVAF